MKKEYQMGDVYSLSLSSMKLQPLFECPYRVAKTDNYD
eukprot:CAMPEP_0185023730 /NCGR_PEP_ID=MMETSP1103-20130426/6369_1 /TAXON_ID=36769 /ORGANISM="Paraphysomonas bandaiensis, Strain Caron Lab Isolate" /LENGTH=37 /DNA_ID= /DNA_START= /DNA_END= /DNA_ORIENTATION=